MCRRNNNYFKKGFTLVETMISVAFLSVLLVGIGIVTNNIIKNYHQGIIIKAVNEIGYTIGEDVRQSIRVGTINIDNDFRKSSNGVYGALCTGDYSYVWNYGAAIRQAQSNSAVTQLIQFENNSSKQIARLVKVKDFNRSFCSDEIFKSAEKVSNQLTDLQKTAITDKNSNTKIIELIKAADNDLMLYDINIKSGLQNLSSVQRIFQISFILGTGSGNEVSIDNVFQCDPGSHGREYCALNKFEISVLSRER